MLQSEAMVAGEYCLWVCIRLRHAILGLGIRGSMHATHRCHGRCHNNQPGAYGKLGEYWKYRCHVNVPHPILQCIGQHYMQKSWFIFWLFGIFFVTLHPKVVSFTSSLIRESEDLIGNQVRVLDSPAAVTSIIFCHMTATGIVVILMISGRC